MKDSNKTILSILVVALLIIAVVGASYAFFTARVSGAETYSTIVVKAGTMDISYNGGANIEALNVAPGWSSTKTFTVTGNNTTSATMAYNITLKVTNNTFSTGALTYTLSGSKSSGGTGTLASNISTAASIATGASTTVIGSGSFLNKPGEIHTYTLTVSFPETGENQNDEQGQRFAAYIEVASVQAS